MKIPIVWTAVIFVALIGLSMRDHLKLRRLRDRHVELVAAIAKRTDSSSIDRIPRDARAGREARTLAIRCLNVGSEPKVRPGMPREQRREAELREMELLDQVGSMNPGEVEKFIAEIRSYAGSGEKLPQFIYAALQELSGGQPRLVLDIFTQTHDGLAASGREEWTVCVALRRLIADDPSGALKWIEVNPGFMTDRVKQEAIAGAVVNDPRLAFKLAGELGCDKPEFIASLAAFFPRSAAVRTEMVAALREYIPSISAEKLRQRTQRDAFEYLAGGIVAEGFKEGARWIDQARLTPEELGGLAEGLAFRVKGPQSGRWLEWAGLALQGPEQVTTVTQMMFKWTRDDPSLAEAWLAGLKESPLRNLAIRGHVDSISSSDPEAAIQWAMALPTGKPREDALKLIHQKWPRHDAAQKAASEAFAKEHGIK